MTDLDIFEQQFLQAERDRHGAVLRQLRRELREAREQRQTETRRLVRGDQGVRK